ncbi:glutathione S-transferase family protein [Variovorax sp. 22077]|uniref:glutathione S-transferase family protein n=1 Tax=Variovorax sp. 22077 TaxID=3453867 RepID=UPI003F86AD80
MIEIYAYATPNSVKVPIALEELGLGYTLHPVNVTQGAQKLESFRALNPNAKVPVLVDTHPTTGERLVLSESAAILVYLAERHEGLLPASGPERARVFEQLFFHASAVSPSFGNAGFFTKLAAEPQPLAQQRFTAEAERVTALLDGLLTERTFVAGDEYSIADIANFGWFWRRAFAGIALDAYPNLSRWFASVEQRPAVQRAIARVDAMAAA